MTIRPALALLVAATAFLAAPAAAESARASGARQVRLDGVVVRLHAGTRQVVTVNRTSGHHARVTYWWHDGHRWRERAQARDGRIGYGGLVVGTRRRVPCSVGGRGHGVLSSWGDERREGRSDRRH